MTGSSAAPLFSVITPCLNRAASIGRAVESVLTQTGAAFEHVVADGGSTDGTLDVLSRYSGVRVLSGPDAGLYDAINRGIAVARGDIIVHLNSDDVLLPGALAAAARILTAQADADAACGGAVVAEDRDDGTLRPLIAYDDPAIKHLRPYDLCRGVPIINARFFRRELYARVGGYDPAFRYAGDRDFLLRAWVAGMRTAVIPERVYVYVQHAGSLTISGEGGRIVPWLDEHLRLAGHWIAAPAAPAPLRREALAWHALETGRAAALAVRGGRFGMAARLIGMGLATDPLWPGRFAVQAVRRVSPIAI